MKKERNINALYENWVNDHMPLDFTLTNGEVLNGWLFGYTDKEYYVCTHKLVDNDIFMASKIIMKSSIFYIEETENSSEEV